MFYSEKCTHCGRCRDLTVNDTDFLCPNDAKEICGKTVTSEEILSEVMKDYAFYQSSGGGITLSGGEPLFQFEFALDVLKKSKERGLHTAVETCGFAKSENVSEIARYVDLFLFDFKESDPALHQSFTGKDNVLILKNLSLLNEMKKEIVLRCPIIPGYNGRQAHYDAICRIGNTMDSVSRIEIEPYHAFGEGKYAAIGREKPSVEPPTDETVCEIISYISQNTTKEVKKA